MEEGRILLHDLCERLHEAVQRLFRLRLRGLDHQRLFDEMREVDGRGMVSEVHEALRDVHRANSFCRRELRGARDELVLPEAPARDLEDHVEAMLEAFS